MTASDRTLFDTLVLDKQGRIVYTFRGDIERGVGGSYKWFSGYSASTKDGGVLYPWMIKRDCHRQAKQFDSKATFAEDRVRFAS